MLDLRHQRFGRGIQSAGVIALTEMWRDVLFDHAPGKRVGDRPLESVTDFDPELPILDENEEDQAVVEFLVADLPAFGAPDRKIFEHFAAERREDVDDELRARSLFESRELFTQRPRVILIEDTGFVCDEGRRGRRDVERKRGARH